MIRKKILLLQFREGQLLKHEFDCVKRKIKCRNFTLESFNAFKKAPSLKFLDRYDAIIFGGCGEYFVSQGNYPAQEKILSLIRKAAEKSIPMLGLCFGFHLIGRALGGKVVHDPEHKEVGTYKITVNRTGRKNILLKNLPSSFLAQEGHKDRLVKLPKDGINLASSKKCRYQAFQIKNKKIFATQFHPELAAKDVKARLIFFKDIYSPGGEYKRILQKTKETPMVEKVIQNFIDIL